MIDPRPGAGPSAAISRPPTAKADSRGWCPCRSAPASSYRRDIDVEHAGVARFAERNGARTVRGKAAFELVAGRAQTNLPACSANSSSMARALVRLIASPVRMTAPLSISLCAKPASP